MKQGEGITVYCASSDMIAPVYFDAARELGNAIANSGATLITGAGRMGLMGAVNDAAISAGGKTIGVIPRFMYDKGWQHPRLSRLEITPDMHRRKETMARLSYGAIAMPGGIGTLEELLEIMTWKKLGLYDGTVVILNTEGYYDNLIAMLRTATDNRFLEKPESIWHVTSSPTEAVRLIMTANAD